MTAPVACRQLWYGNRNSWGFRLGRDVPPFISSSLPIICNVIVPEDLVRLAARTQSHDEKHCDVAQWRGKS